MRFHSLEPDHEWSFSSLTAYETCPRMFALQYLADPPVPQDENAFAQQGTLCHSLLEGYAKGELAEFCLADEYKERFDSAVTAYFPPFPKGGGEKAYNACLQYFENFDGFGDQYEILSAEEPFKTNIRGNILKGVVDLTLRDKNTGSITVIDHKTTSESSFAKKQSTYRKQLYIYAAHIHEQYGEYPSLLRFNLLKPQRWFDETFSMDALRETEDWICQTIQKIRADAEWKSCLRAQEEETGKRPKQNYFCQWICGVSNFCEDGIDLWQR